MKMKMKTLLEEYISRRLKAIQKRRNFNPATGTKQVTENPKLAKEYGRFRELVDQIQKLELNVPVPYDPTATGRSESKDVTKNYKIYFMRRYDNLLASDIYKLGYSYQPSSRIKSLQTAQDGTLRITHVFDISKEKKEVMNLERMLKFRFRKFKTRDLNHPHKGEYFRLPPHILNPELQNLHKLAHKFKISIS